MDNKIEKRVNLDLDLSLEERQAQGEGQEQEVYIRGQAIVFDKFSTLIYERGKVFQEMIAKGSITEELIRKSNILFLLNHNRDQVIARNRPNTSNEENSLKIYLKDDGVFFECKLDLVYNDLHKRIYSELKNGVLNQCSFGFRIKEELFYNTDKESLYRKILEISDLSDLSLVHNPAYEDTFAELYERGLKTIEEEENYKKENLSKYDSFLEKLNNN